jgi:hypothetical protein
MIEVKTIYDLPITMTCASEVEYLSVALGIDPWQALEQIIETWHDLTFDAPINQRSLTLEDGESIENQDNPLDVIEAKLERISGLCDQLIEKLDLTSL